MSATDEQLPEVGSVWGVPMEPRTWRLVESVDNEPGGCVQFMEAFGVVADTDTDLDCWAAWVRAIGATDITAALRAKPAETGETVPPLGSLEATAAAVAEVRDGLAKIQSACAESGMPLPPLPMTPRERFERKHPALAHLRKSRPESMSPELVRACLMELLHSVAYLAVEASDKAVVEAQVRSEP